MNFRVFQIARQAALLAAVMLPAALLAQTRLSIIPIVPAADWRQINSQPLPISELTQFHGEPAIEKEYGVSKVELRTYAVGKRQQLVIVESAGDATAAYGLLTFYRSPGMELEKNIELAAGDSDQTLMARGGNFLRFLRGRNQPVTENEFQALLLFVGGEKPSASVLKSLPSSMPATDLIPGTEKYLLGPEAAKRAIPDFRTDLLGFDQSAEVQLGQYRTQDGAATLISIGYPTPQIARVRFGALSSLISLNQDRGSATAYGTRHGSYVFLVLNTRTQAAAQKLLGLFEVTQGVAWDQKYFSERSFTLQLVHMFLAIFMLIAILIGACALFGVGIFLSRRLAARFFPNSQWAHPEADRLIRLDLKFK